MHIRDTSHVTLRSAHRCRTGRTFGSFVSRPVVYGTQFNNLLTNGVHWLNSIHSQYPPNNQLSPCHFFLTEGGLFGIFQRNRITVQVREVRNGWWCQACWTDSARLESQIKVASKRFLIYEACRKMTWITFDSGWVDVARCLARCSLPRNTSDHSSRSLRKGCRYETCSRITFVSGQVDVSYRGRCSVLKIPDSGRLWGSSDTERCGFAL